MKKLIERIGTETAFGGFFGIIAIVAVFFEMAVAGFDAASVAGGIKDIAGTVITVVMLITAIRALKPRKKAATGFDEKFNEEMDHVISKYSPLIEKDASVPGRYNIADDMSVLYQSIDCKYHKLFDFDKKGELSFNVSKTLFMGKSKNDFTQLQATIIRSVTSKVIGEFDILDEKYKTTPDGFRLTFSQELRSSEDAIKVAAVIDKIILLYIVEYKK